MGSELNEITVNKVIVPDAGDYVKECQLTKWHIQDGSQVRCGDLIATLENDIVTTEIESEFTGVITLLAKEQQTLGIGEIIAEVRSNSEDLKHMEIKESEPLAGSSQSNQGKSKPRDSSSMIKLIALVLIAFVVMKYGVPLMNQISEKSTEVLSPDDTTESKPAEEKSTPTTKATTPKVPAVRITKGYENWESGVREQLGYWVKDGVKYNLLSIEVNDANEIMEIRFITQDKVGFLSKEKLVLKKDGFGDRFIYSGGKIEDEIEFLVYPPE